MIAAPARPGGWWHTVPGGDASYALSAACSLALHLSALAPVALLLEGEPAQPQLIVAVELVTAMPGGALPMAEQQDTANPGVPGDSATVPERPSPVAQAEAAAAAKSSPGAPPPAAAQPAPSEQPNAPAEPVVSPGEIEAFLTELGDLEPPAPTPEPSSAPIPRIKPERPPSEAADPRPRPASEPTPATGELQRAAAPPSSAASGGASTGARHAVTRTTAPSYEGLGDVNPRPGYPYGARVRGEEGQVIVRVRVAATGVAESAAVHNSSGSRRLDEEAVRTVERWQFMPATSEGEAVAGTVDVPITFRLED